MASPFQSSPFLKVWFFSSNDSAVYFPLPAASFSLWASLFHPLCSKRKVRDSSFSLMQAGGDREWLRALEKERRANNCTPRLLPSSPQKSPLGEFIPLALSDCLLVQCALCISRSQLMVEEENKHTMREVSLMAKTRKYASQIRGSNCSDTLLNQLPTLLSNQSFPSYLEEATGDLSPTVSYVLRRGRLPPTWNKECHKRK